MLRRFADSVFQALLSRFPADRAYPRSSFDREEMPSTVTRYLTHALDSRLEIELARLQPQSAEWFQVDHPDVKRAFDEYVASLKKGGQFPAGEWQVSLERAVRNTVSYHVRPARTVVELLFARETDVYTRDGLRKRLAFLGTYPRLSEALDRFAEENGDDFDRQAVEAVVEEVDRSMTTDHDVRAWLELIDPLFEIASVLPEYDGVVPVELLLLFFRDKGAPRVERHFEQLHEGEGIDLVSRTRLESLLRESIVEAQPKPVRHERVVDPERAAPSPPSAPSQSTPRQHAPPQSTPSESAQPQSGPPEPVRPDHRGPVPLWQQFRKTGNEDSQPLHRVQIHREVPRPEAPSEARPLWMRFSNDAPGSSHEGERDRAGGSLDRIERIVLGEVAAHDRDTFVRNLFRGSRQDYAATLARIEQAQSWSEASRIIANDVFRRNEVDIYSDPAVSFTNAIEARFQQSHH